MSLLDEKSVSDEKLNAYLDDELDFDEKRRMYDVLCEDQELSQEAQELRQLHYLLQHAYRNPPLPQQRRISNFRQRRRYYLQGFAASLILALGALMGWFSHQEFESGFSYTQKEVVTNLLPQPDKVAEQDISLSSNVILHLNSADPLKFKAALDRSEELLRSHRLEGREFHLEIITNGGGVELLRKDKSPFPQRVEALMAEYANVSFMACANALRQLEEQGVKVDLLPGVQANQPAIDTIIHRLEQGWSYLRV